MFVEREIDGFINATQLCQNKGKSVNEYLRSALGRNFVKSACKKLEKTKDELIHAQKGRGGSTWVHPVVAQSIAHWISTDEACDIFIYHYEKRLEAEKGKDQAVQELRTAECQIPALKEAYEAGKTNADLISDILQAKQNCNASKNYDRMLYRNYCNTLVDLVKEEGVPERVVRSAFNLLNDTFRSWVSLHKPNDAEYHDHWHTFEQTVASMVKVSKIA